MLLKSTFVPILNLWYEATVGSVFASEHSLIQLHLCVTWFECRVFWAQRWFFFSLGREKFTATKRFDRSGNLFHYLRCYAYQTVKLNRGCSRNRITYVYSTFQLQYIKQSRAWHYDVALRAC